MASPRFLPERYDRAGWVRLGLALTGAVLTVCVVVLAWQGVRAAILLSRASDQSQLLLAQVAQGDADGARQTSAVLTDAAGRAHASTDGPLWAVFSHVPIVGDDVDAVRVVAREVDRVAVEAVPTIVDVTAQVGLDAFSPRDGRVDIANLEAVAPRLAGPREALERAARDVGEIEPQKVVGRLQAPVRRLQGSLTGAASAARIADTAATLLPDMLGGSERRRYLLLIQNNAEIRSLGGIPGSFAVIEADRGKVRMRAQGSAIDVPPNGRPRLTVPDDQLGAVPVTAATDLRNTTSVPDFPEAAAFASSLVAEELDTRFDGVVSVDPVTLGYLLQGLGPVTLEDGTRLTAENAVDELLNGVYRRYATDLLGQDAVFEDAARRIFDAFVDGQGATQPVLEALVQASVDNRVLVWSADESEQRRIRSTGVAGALAQTRDRAHVGVYVDDSLGSKLQYYLDTSSTLRSVRCVDERAQVLSLRTTLTSTVPDTALPISITGLELPGLRPGDQRLSVRVVAPAGGVLERVRLGDTERTPSGGRIGDRRVTVVPVTLRPGESVDLEVQLRTGEGQTSDAVLTTTPGIEAGANDVRVRSACG
ncbi:DUF4012 domain-containing protein [Aeromicrobium sp. 50.2.37]|uniref:DUF4012 domain-containing protein n=1 Tax=Aeromicrobium sp. 50.2.37 TaxID=2969305 RepID=UPI0021502DFB|nr:DUF4012 domain-containing protein [Aeromicrobium sp. 50.2.37]MCR4512708.1 DUF4012 domain-containing protein [Aeromicrobium sp. 50.2.37]